VGFLEARLPESLAHPDVTEAQPKSALAQRPLSFGTIDGNLLTPIISYLVPEGGIGARKGRNRNPTQHSRDIARTDESPISVAKTSAFMGRFTPLGQIGL
jgi:hypothetical protein